MHQAPTTRTPARTIEVSAPVWSPGKERRLLALERLMAALEDELSDEELSDEQRLQNIGERLAGAADDGRRS